LDLAQEALLGERRQRLVHRAADEQEAGEVLIERDRAGDHVEAQVTLVDDAAPVARAGGAQLVPRHLDRLVAAAAPLLGEQRKVGAPLGATYWSQLLIL